MWWWWFTQENDGDMVILAIKSRWFELSILIFGQNEFHGSPPTLKRVASITVGKPVMVILPHFLWWNGENREKLFQWCFIQQHKHKNRFHSFLSISSAGWMLCVGPVSFLSISSAGRMLWQSTLGLRFDHFVSVSNLIRVPHFPQHFLSRLNVMQK